MVVWSSVVSHAIYGGIALATAGLDLHSFAPAHASFVLIAIRSITGILFALQDENNETTQKIYEFVDWATWFLAFPLFVTHLWMKHGLRMEYAYIHAAGAVVPFALYLMDKDFEDACSVLTVGCTISAAYVAAVERNWYALGAAGVFAITHGVIKLDGDDEDSSKKDRYNYMLALYLVLAWHAW